MYLKGAQGEQMIDTDVTNRANTKDMSTAHQEAEGEKNKPKKKRK